jgi:hypothetical protein
MVAPSDTNPISDQGAEYTQAHPQIRSEPLSAILRLLVEYRFLTSSQFHTKLDFKYQRQTLRYLERARAKGLLTSSRCEPDQGRRSELYWQLTARGIHTLEATDGVYIGYNTRYWRKPGLARLKTRQSEIELEQQVAQANWRLIRPRTTNQYKPLPAYTRQYKAIAAALTLIEQRYHPPGHPIALDGPHTLAIPLKLNEYVAQSQDKTRSVVLLLCPYRFGETFWAERIKKYGQLAQKLPVVAVFGEATQALVYQTLLEDAKIVVTTLDRVGSGLSNL